MCLLDQSGPTLSYMISISDSTNVGVGDRASNNQSFDGPYEMEELGCFDANPISICNK